MIRSTMERGEMKRPAFNIGDWVTATHCVEFSYETDQPESECQIDDNHWEDRRTFHRRVRKVEQQIVGQVVGGRTRPLGEFRNRYSYGTEDGYEEVPSYLEVKSTVFVYLVREGFTNRPIEVLQEDLVKCEPPKRGLPMRKSVQPAIDDKYRQLLSEFAKEMDRTPNGRFAKVKK